MTYRTHKSVLEDAIGLVDELIKLESSRLFYGINGPLHGKLSTIRGTMAAALRTSAQDSVSIRAFAQAILHGNADHRSWLIEAAECFIRGDAPPKPRGLQPSNEATSTDVLRDALDKLEWAAEGFYLEQTPEKATALCEARLQARKALSPAKEASDDG